MRKTRIAPLIAFLLGIPRRGRSGDQAPRWPDRLVYYSITPFGRIGPKLVTQYARHWRIFEWHPQPGAAAEALRLYDALKADLEA